MLRQRALVAGAMGGAQTYTQQIQDLFGSAIVGYWPLNELTGTTAFDLSGNARNGAYTGATLNAALGPDGNPCPSFAGTDRVDVFSAGFAGAFNVAEGTLSIWFKVDDVIRWVETAAHYSLWFASTNRTTNHFFLRHTGTLNQIGERRRANNITNERTLATLNTDTWHLMTITWSVAADQVRTYLDGAEYGAATSSLGVFDAGGLAFAWLGCEWPAGTNGWKGNLAHGMVLNRPATPAEVAKIFLLNYETTSPAVMVTFDDGLAAQYTTAFPLMVAKGIKGTFYVNSPNIDQTGYMTTAQLQEMNTAGMRIGNHTTSDTNISALSQADQQTAMTDCKTFLDAAGLTAASADIAYPQGGYSYNTMLAMNAAGMLTGRNTTGSVEYINLKTNGGKFQIPGNMVLSSTAVATVTGWIDTALAQRRILTLGFHDLVAAGPTTYQYKTADFTSILNYIVSSGIPSIDVVNYRTLL